jgi:hypothetical protein
MKILERSQVTHPKQRLLHIKAHFVVVQPHDPHKALEGPDYDLNRCILGCLADNLHDIVPFALATRSVYPDIDGQQTHLSFKVVAHKLERVEKSVDRGQLDLC